MSALVRFAFGKNYLSTNYIHSINSKPKPSALYVSASSRSFQDRLASSISSIKRRSFCFTRYLAWVKQSGRYAIEFGHKEERPRRCGFRFHKFLNPRTSLTWRAILGSQRRSDSIWHNKCDPSPLQQLHLMHKLTFRKVGVSVIIFAIYMGLRSTRKKKRTEASVYSDVETIYRSDAASIIGAPSNLARPATARSSIVASKSPLTTYR